MPIQILTESDIPMVRKLIGDAPQKIGFSDTVISNEEYFEYLDLCIVHPLHKTYAYFNDAGDLVSYITLCDFPALPYYAVINFKVVKKFNIYDQEQNGMHQFQEVYFSKEKENRYSFYKLRGFRSPRLMKRVTKNLVNAMPVFFDRYHRTIEEFIPAGQYSKYDPFNKLLFRGHTFNDDSVIFKFTCKQEYRTNIPDYVQEATMQMETMKNIKIGQ